MGLTMPTVDHWEREHRVRSGPPPYYTERAQHKAVLLDQAFSPPPRHEFFAHPTAKHLDCKGQRNLLAKVHVKQRQAYMLGVVIIVVLICTLLVAIVVSFMPPHCLRRALPHDMSMADGTVGDPAGGALGGTVGGAVGSAAVVSAPVVQLLIVRGAADRLYVAPRRPLLAAPAALSVFTQLDGDADIDGSVSSCFLLALSRALSLAAAEDMPATSSAAPSTPSADGNGTLGMTARAVPLRGAGFKLLPGGVRALCPPAVLYRLERPMYTSLDREKRSRDELESPKSIHLRLTNPASVERYERRALRMQ